METLRGPLTKNVTYVLVLDDDSTLARVLGLAMEDYGIPAIVLGNADDGLDWINTNPGQLALLLTDISMPGEIDGVELARQIAERSPDIPAALGAETSQRIDFSTSHLISRRS
ncbi:response regulator [Pseudomonas sp. PDM23]|uniref:response regulator n=1 Tax=unclassified Pseudomonas TaxID=196821 RepID=UPI001784A61A|nr:MULTISPECIES: response regulator [unclassified Pseudomonas]MBD9503767.1 response regulator [Pseudomonas sp. PDM17]MBD9574825.1 response regulator [Pseudomonas sp. PDM23]